MASLLLLRNPEALNPNLWNLWSTKADCLTCWPVSHVYFNLSFFVFCFVFFLKSKCKNLRENIRSFFWISRWVEKSDRPCVELLIWLLLTTFLLSCYCPSFVDGHVCRIEMWGVFCPTSPRCTLAQENWSPTEQVPFLVQEVHIRQN